MKDPWDPEALWTKAKLFINRAFSDGADFHERAMWASLSLELLAKATLARVNPLLIANPTDEGGSLLAAAGLSSGTPTFKSVMAKTLYTRCGKAFKPFNANIATTIAESRNEYVHGAAASFTDQREDVWWSRFWAQAVILIEAYEQDVHGFVGQQRLADVVKHLARNTEHVHNLVQARMARAQLRLDQLEARQLPAREYDRLAKMLDPSIQLIYSTQVYCPVCGKLGLLEGDDVISHEVSHMQVAEDDWDTHVEGTVAAEYFSCSHCGFVLDSYELLVAAEMDTEFTTTDIDPHSYYEPDYGND